MSSSEVKQLFSRIMVVTVRVERAEVRVESWFEDVERLDSDVNRDVIVLIYSRSAEAYNSDSEPRSR